LDYAYRAAIGVWMFVLGGVGALVIALAAVGYKKKGPDRNPARF